MKKILFLLILLNVTILGQDNSLGGMKFGVNVDLVHSSDLEENEHLFKPREVELFFYGPVNHLFDASISVAAHNEGGEFQFELHEAWISSSSLVKNFDLKLGQYFLNIGRMNKVHRHEWPFISAPRFYEEMFGEEGVSDSGLEVNYRFPGSLNFSLLAGLASGRTFGHSHSEGEQPDLPTNYLRFGYFFEAFDWNGFELGVNYLNRINSEGDQTLFFGMDFVGKKKTGPTLKHLIQSEVWSRTSSFNVGGDDRHELGCYVYYQYGFTNEWALGARLDYFTDLSRKDFFGNTQKYYDLRAILSMTFQPSEFLRFKLDYSNGIEILDSTKLQQTNKIELQVTFNLGAHPSHDF